MINTVLSQLGGYSRFLKTESNARRLSRLIRIFQDKKPEIDLANELSNLISPEVLDRILKDSNFWFPFEIERDILLKLENHISVKEIYFQIGKLCFSEEIFQILPSDNLQINFHELLSRLPIFIDNYIRYIETDLIEVKENYLKVKLSFFEHYHETNYDIYFLRGMVDAAVNLFQVKNFQVKVFSTMLNSDQFEKNFILDTDSIFNSINSEYFFSWEESKLLIGKTNYSSIVPKIEPKIFLVSDKNESNETVSYLDMNDVLAKSKELFYENRDLEAAVEVLKSLKNELVIKQKSIAKDLRIARNIQRGIIPQKIPDWQGLQFAVSFMPMQEVSGDYYDYFNFGSNRLGILLCDVSGHGVPAAFITAISKLLFTNYKLDSPSEIFGNANSELLDLVKQLGYLTCFYGIVDLDYEMTYSIAGHPRPILFKYQTKEIISLEGEGTFLGMFDDAREHFKDYKIKLEPGDKLFIYTDGLVEGMSDEGNQFETVGLIKTIEETYGMNVQESLDYIMGAFHKFTRGTDQGDDITLLCVGLSLNMIEFEKYKADAEVFFEQGEFELAAENLHKAIKILPNDLNVLLILGKCYAKIQNYKEAIQYLEEYNNLKTYNADSHLILGYCYYKLEDFGKAEIELQKSVSLRSQNIPALLYLARTLARLNQFEKALGIVNKILYFENDNRVAHLMKDFLEQKIAEEQL